jgi:ribosomal protein S18 acetylase RimI-like enzyme
MIRRGTINDVELLENIGRTTFEDTFGGTCTKADMKYVLERFFNKQECINQLQDPTDNFFFLEEEDVVKGYMRINNQHVCPVESISHYKTVELVRFYVLKEFHGTGVADRLMKFATDYAIQQGFECIYLSVWEYNFRARGFYEKHGFLNSGIENDFPLGSTPQTDLWFTKNLR